MFQSVAVIGTGTIGASWAALFLSKGLRVIACDPAVGAETLLRKRISDLNEGAGHPTHLDQTSQERLEFVKDIGPRLGEVDFVQENGPEKVDYKRDIFSLLDEHAKRDVVLASSSSGLPSSTFTSQCRHPERILTGHPFNPPHLIPLVEIVPNPKTTKAATETATKFYRSLGKTPVIINREIPGFVANRLQAALVHEAYSCVSRGIVSAEEIDLIVSNSIALRWALQGPFITKALGGGGGGIDGFKAHLRHVGKAADVWTEDMKKHAWVSSDDNKEILIKNVQEELDRLHDVDLGGERDDFLVQILALKSKYKSHQQLVSAPLP